LAALVGAGAASAFFTGAFFVAIGAYLFSVGCSVMPVWSCLFGHACLVMPVSDDWSVMPDQ